MSKAILVINMPTCCEECPCYQAEMNYETIEYHYCGVDGHMVRWNDLPKYDSCPLKHMPAKKVPVFNPNDCDTEEEIQIIHEIDGYNVCIDEILGEEE